MENEMKALADLQRTADLDRRCSTISAFIMPSATISAFTVVALVSSAAMKELMMVVDNEMKALADLQRTADLDRAAHPPAPSSCPPLPSAPSSPRS